MQQPLDTESLSFYSAEMLLKEYNWKVSDVLPSPQRRNLFLSASTQMQTCMRPGYENISDIHVKPFNPISGKSSAPSRAQIIHHDIKRDPHVLATYNKQDLLKENKPTVNSSLASSIQQHLRSDAQKTSGANSGMMVRADA